MGKKCAKKQIKRQNKELNFAYDDAFRTLESECDDVLIPLVNYFFDEDYDMTAKITRLRNEGYRGKPDKSLQKRITDSRFAISKEGKEKL